MSVEMPNCFSWPDNWYNKKFSNCFFQLLPVHVLAQAHVEMQHRIGCPFRFQFLHGQSFKEFFTAFEIGMQRADEQRFAETTRTVQEQVAGIAVCHAVHLFRLVNIQIMLVYKLGKCLYPYGVTPWLFHVAEVFSGSVAQR